MQLQLAQARAGVVPSLSRSSRAPVAARRAVAVRAGLGEDLINKLTVAIKNSPLNQGKVALAVSQAGDYDAAATKALIDKSIADNGCVVFSWSGCPFCKKAKAVLDAAGAKYVALELDQRPDGKAIRAELAKMTGRSSVPNIWIGNENVGGCNDGPGVQTLQNEGKLVPMLQAAGAL